MESTISDAGNSAMATADSVRAVFQAWVEDLDAESVVKEAIRERVRELDAAGREVAGVLQRVHQSSGYARLNDVVSEAEALLSNKVCTVLGLLSQTVPRGQFYRFHFMYNYTIQRLVFQAAFTRYLKDETLLTLRDAALILGIDPMEPSKGSQDLKNEASTFHLDLEDYLAGLILMSNELARFSVNVVTHGDYSRPPRIATFLSDLGGGFRLLNLKNDTLRKKFDSLKYDMKQVEKVVYDLSIRGLLKPDRSENPASEDSDVVPS